MPDILLIPPDIPTIQIRHEHHIVHRRVRDRPLNPWHHVVLHLAVGVLSPGPAVLRDHALELRHAGEQGGHGGDEAGAEEEVGELGDVGEGLGRGVARREEGRFDGDGREEIQDVEAEGQDGEGDGEMHEGRVDGGTGRESVSAARVGGVAEVWWAGRPGEG